MIPDRKQKRGDGTANQHKAEICRSGIGQELMPEQVACDVSNRVDKYERWDQPERQFKVLVSRVAPPEPAHRATTQTQPLALAHIAENGTPDRPLNQGRADG
jgi:hypothetical protein